VVDNAEAPSYSPICSGGPSGACDGWSHAVTALLAASLVYRERKGIGFEGVAILVVYCAGFTTVALSSH